MYLAGDICNILSVVTWAVFFFAPINALGTDVAFKRVAIVLRIIDFIRSTTLAGCLGSLKYCYERLTDIDSYSLSR